MNDLLTIGERSVCLPPTALFSFICRAFSLQFLQQFKERYNLNIPIVQIILNPAVETCLSLF